MTGHRSWSAGRKGRLTDPEIARRAAEARAALEEQCAHCGRVARGYARGLDGERLCHGETGPDCYRRVTVYGEPLGALIEHDHGPELNCQACYQGEPPQFREVRWPLGGDWPPGCVRHELAAPDCRYCMGLVALDLSQARGVDERALAEGAGAAVWDHICFDQGKCYCGCRRCKANDHTQCGPGAGCHTDCT